MGLYLVAPWRRRILNPELLCLHLPLSAMTVSYAVGILALSRCYTVTTYLVPALVTVYLGITPVSPPGPVLRLDGSLLKRLALVGFVMLAATYIFVRVLVRFDVD
jgi:hypothetical protein